MIRHRIVPLDVAEELRIGAQVSSVMGVFRDAFYRVEKAKGTGVEVSWSDAETGKE